MISPEMLPMKKLKTLFLCLSLFAMLVAPLSACNTVAGMGRDMRAAGDAVTGATGR
jgi:predicted small secreted protein